MISALDVVGLRGARCDVPSRYASLALLGRLLQHPSLRAPTGSDPGGGFRGKGIGAAMPPVVSGVVFCGAVGAILSAHQPSYMYFDGGGDGLRSSLTGH